MKRGYERGAGGVDDLMRGGGGGRGEPGGGRDLMGRGGGGDLIQGLEEYEGGCGDSKGGGGGKDFEGEGCVCVCVCVWGGGYEEGMSWRNTIKNVWRYCVSSRCFPRSFHSNQMFV